MPTTTTKERSLQDVLNNANPQDLPDAIAQLGLGDIANPFVRTFTGLAASASFDLTAIDGTGETAGAANPKRRAALIVSNLRITASGTAASLGSYVAGDANAVMIIPPGGASVAVGVARISDDGKTITFPNTVTGFVISYVPRKATPAQLAAAFAPR